MNKMSSRLSKSIIIILFIVFLASCQLRAKLVVAPESTINNLYFVLSAWSEQTPGNLRAVYMYRCVEQGSQFPENGECLWATRVKDGEKPPVLGRFGYGHDIPGFATSQEPKPLRPGCYIVRAYADFPDPRSAVLVFRISSDGKITSEEYT